MIKIVYACNDGYFDGLYLSILSIVRRCKKPISFYLLSANCTNIKPRFKIMSKKHCSILSLMVQKYNPNNSFKMIDCTQLYKIKLGGNINEKNKYSPYATFRLFLDQYKCFHDKVIYLDVDTMANGNIEKLYNLKIKNNEFLVCHDALGRYWKNFDYFNSGVILFNVNQMIKNQTFKKALAIIRAKKMAFVDQDALYKACTKYDFFPNEYRYNRQQPKVYKNDVLKHFCQQLKHWPLLNNIKQWDIKNVHKILKIHAFDEDFRIYQKEKKKWGKK